MSSMPVKDKADFVTKHHTNQKKFGGGFGGRPGPRPGFGFGRRPGFGYRRPPYGRFGRFGRFRRRAPWGWRPRRRFFRGRWWYWWNNRFFPYWPYPYAYPAWGFY